MIKLSIIIVNFNSGNFLKECLLSIQKSTLSAKDCEIIIIDNNSDDASIKGALSVKGINTILIKNKENLGFAKANNLGIKKSTGEYILLLNPDTVVADETFKVMLTFMDKYKNTAVSSCHVELPNGQLDDACHRGFPTPSNALFHFLGLANLFPASKFLNGYHLGYQDLDKIHEIDSCTGAFMLVRKSIGEKIKWLDEDYFWYGEDIDFCFRVKEKGYKVMYVPLTKIIHYKGITSGIKNISKNLSTADKKTKILATKARFEVMRIFYKKHYKKRYPSWLTDLVFTAIKIKEYYNLLKLRVRP